MKEVKKNWLYHEYTYQDMVDCFKDFDEYWSIEDTKEYAINEKYPSETVRAARQACKELGLKL